METSVNNETWTKWIPNNEISGQYCIKIIDDNIGKFSILLNNEKNASKNVLVNFYESIDISRGIKIKYFKNTLQGLENKYGKNFLSKWSFFKINNSNFIAWLNEESYEWIDSSFTHFVILGSNYILEVITNYEPKIEFIE